MENIHSEDEARELLESISNVFINFLKDLLHVTKNEQINLVGIGNSISAGWTATDNNVQPWIEKLKPFIEEKCQHEGVNLDFGAFTLAGDNSNEKIYEFLLKNPSKKDVKEHFIRIFDSWKEEFNGTPLENWVDRAKSLEYYSDSDRSFEDYFGHKIFTITSFNGCTGELLDDFKSILTPRGRERIIAKEILYLEKIILYIISLSESSYITVGNFPQIANKYLSILNHIVSKFNERIRSTTYRFDKAFFFSGINIDLISRVNGKLKLDNHPSITRQYVSLYNYIIFLMRTLSQCLADYNKSYKFQKYMLLTPQSIKKQI